MLSRDQPAPALRPYVSGYWRVCDIAGVYRGRPIDTAPSPGAVLTVNVGRPNRSANGHLTPMVSLLGVQRQARAWYSDADTHFVMALLTPLGLARLFPGAGAEAVDVLVDLGAFLGDGIARALLNDASARPDTLSAALDAWLLARLAALGAPQAVALFGAAQRELARASRVSAAAQALGISRRHLTRLVSGHIGVGPKELLDLHRLDRSLMAVQRGGEGCAGFSDQAHQIREWRRRLRTTPGCYAGKGCSRLAEAFHAEQPCTVLYL